MAKNEFILGVIDSKNLQSKRLPNLVVSTEHGTD